jgi:hypothetical protein
MQVIMALALGTLVVSVISACGSDGSSGSPGWSSTGSGASAGSTVASGMMATSGTSFGSGTAAGGSAAATSGAGASATAASGASSTGAVSSGGASGSSGPMGSASNDAGTSDASVGDAGGVTFAQVYAIMSTHCCTACHAPMPSKGTPMDGCIPQNVMKNTGFTSAKLDLSTQSIAYTSLVGVKSALAKCGPPKNLLRVVAGNSAMSVLYSMIHDVMPKVPICGPQMPYNQPPLAAADMATIKAWIDEGAPNN